MNKFALIRFLFTIALGLSVSGLAGGDSYAQIPSTAAKPDTGRVADPIGDLDTLFTEITRTGPRDWTVNVSYFSDIDLFALSIPLKYRAGLTQVVIDSTVFTGGSADHFRIKMARPDTAIQCLTIGLIAALNPNAETLPAGKGRLATVFLHALGDKEAPALIVDTTTTYPENTLMFVKNSKPPENKQTKIYPAYVVTSNEKPKEK